MRISGQFWADGGKIRTVGNNIPEALAQHRPGEALPAKGRSGADAPLLDYRPAAPRPETTPGSAPGPADAVAEAPIVAEPGPSAATDTGIPAATVAAAYRTAINRARFGSGLAGWFSIDA